jgi:predicted permease
VWASDQVSIADGVERKSVEVIWVDGNFFEALDMPALRGRVLARSDDRRDGGADGPVTVLSYTFWTRRYGRDPSVLGQTLNIQGTPFRIVGITPSGFFGLDIGKTFDVVLPLETEPLLGRVPSRINSAAWPWLRITGRLGPGATIESVQSRLRTAQPQIRVATMPPYTKAELRDAYLAKPWTLRHAGTGSSRLRGRYAAALLTLLAIVGFVLLIACANLANLQLARISARRYELSVKSALGASRFRIVQEQLVESVLLAAAGAALGYAVAQWGSRVIVSQLSNWASMVFLDLSPDLRVLAVTIAVTVLTAVLFGSVPAGRAASADPLDSLKAHASGAGPGGRFGGASVITQIALSLVLVLGAALFLRSFAKLAYRDLGFDRARVLVAVVEAGPSRDKAKLAEQLRERLSGVPGVESAAISMATPLGNAGLRFTRDITLADTRTASNVFTVPVSPDWFHTYGTPLVSGRDFSIADASGSAGVAIVNQAFVRRFLGEGDPVGRELVMSDDDRREPLQIVGVVRDAAFTSVRAAIEPTIYRPLAQFTDAELLAATSSLCVSIRAGGALRSEALRRAISTAIERVDAGLAVTFLPLATYLDAYYMRERLLAVLSAFFGTLALVLAAVGLYGVTANFVNQRQREIAVRIALGARGAEVLRLVVLRFTRLIACGVLAGLTLGWWAGRLVRTLLYGIDAHDTGTYLAAAIVMLIVGLIASWIPARRAARLNPAELLRS